MIKNFFIVAIRNLLRQKLNSLLNVLGLTIGIAAATLLLLYVNDELSYDGMHPLKDRMYRVNTIAIAQDTEMNVAQTMAPMGPVLKNDYPEVETYCRIQTISRELVTKDDIQFFEENFYLADSTFFNVFNIKLLKGNPESALAEPNTIVLSQALAQKYFGDEDPIGKTIKTGAEEWSRTVTGVMENPLSGTHIKPSGIISYLSIPEGRRTFWGNINDYLYIVLQQGTDYKQFEQNFSVVFDKYINQLFSQFDAKATFHLTPFTDIHLNAGDVDGQMEPGGSMAYVYTFSAIAFFILLIASINYMNMSTARAVHRAKEVGIRKVMGSHRRQLRSQFIVESILITALSAFLALIIVSLTIPVFNAVSGKAIPESFYMDYRFVSLYLFLSVAIGVIAGSYPALYLSSFKPALVLKGKKASVSGNVGLRKGLVIIQFSISLIMIICTAVVYDQLVFMNSKNLGFNKDQVLRISLNGSAAREKYPVLRSTFLQNSNIEAVGSGWASPGGENLNVQGIGVETKNGNMIDKVFQSFVVDQYYLEALQIPVVQGRGFLETVGQDTTEAILVNQQMVKEMGWDNPIGKKFNVILSEALDRRIVKVVGVIQDFHVRALQEPIEPLVLHLNLDNGLMLVRVKSENIDQTIKEIEAVWRDVVSNRPFEYSFLEQDFQDQYEQDQRRGEIFATFSGLTIFIACMGLFGLASYSSEVRKKEIGIRKVVGATITDILILMNKEFVKLVAISMLIAFPTAYYFMSGWLENFTFRVEISWFTFVISAFVTLIITLVTVGYHSLNAAVSNPSVSLKEE
ncbi:MAG: ABC transporter permease [Cyclobacteriaceae bacterium]